MIKYDAKTTCYSCDHFYLLETSDIYYKMVAVRWGHRYDPPPEDVKQFYFHCPVCNVEKSIHQDHVSKHAKENCKLKQ